MKTEENEKQSLSYIFKLVIAITVPNVRTTVNFRAIASAHSLISLFVHSSVIHVNFIHLRATSTNRAPIALLSIHASWWGMGSLFLGIVMD